MCRHRRFVCNVGSFWVCLSLLKHTYELQHDNNNNNNRYEIDSDCQSTSETSVSCLLGFDTKPYHHVKGEDNNALMLNSNYLPQLAIMLLVSLQQINYSAILAASRRSKSFSSTTSNYVPSELRSVFVRGSQMVAFVLPMMILFMALVFSLTPPLNVVGVFYLLIYFFVLYMRYPSPRTRAMKHLLRLFCVLLCCVFMARYVIQFNAFIPKIGSKIFTK